jgi:hypothetical protein
MTCYVATPTGFLCEDVEGFYVTSDIRLATPFRNFRIAESAYKQAWTASAKMFDDWHYYAVLNPSVERQGKKWRSDQ